MRGRLLSFIFLSKYLYHVRSYHVCLISYLPINQKVALEETLGKKEHGYKGRAGLGIFTFRAIPQAYQSGQQKQLTQFPPFTSSPSASWMHLHLIGGQQERLRLPTFPKHMCCFSDPCPAPTHLLLISGQQEHMILCFSTCFPGTPVFG